MIFDTKFFFLPLSDLLSAQPDLTQTVVTIRNHHTLDTPNNNHIGSMEKMPIYSEPINIVPNNLDLLLDPNSMADSDVPEPPPRKESSNPESRPNSVYSERTNRPASVISCQVSYSYVKKLKTQFIL